MESPQNCDQDRQIYKSKLIEKVILYLRNQNQHLKKNTERKELKVVKLLKEVISNSDNHNPPLKMALSSAIKRLACVICVCVCVCDETLQLVSDSDYEIIGKTGTGYVGVWW